MNAAIAVFEKCCEEEDSLYIASDGWRGWEEYHKKNVQWSLEEYVSKFMKFFNKVDIKSSSQL